MGTDDGDSRGDENSQDIDGDEISNEGTVVDPSNASGVSERLVEPSQALTEFWLPESLRRCLLPTHFRISENERASFV
jgi:hypothetical protein